MRITTILFALVAMLAFGATSFGADQSQGNPGISTDQASGQVVTQKHKKKKHKKKKKGAAQPDAGAGAGTGGGSTDNNMGGGTPTQ